MPFKTLAVGGGGIDTSDATAVAGDVRMGTTAYTAIGKVNGALTPLDTSDATAVAGDITLGKTVYINGEKVTGLFSDPSKTIPIKTAPSIPIRTVSGSVI